MADLPLFSFLALNHNILKTAKKYELNKFDILALMVFESVPNHCLKLNQVRKRLFTEHRNIYRSLARLTEKRYLTVYTKKENYYKLTFEGKQIINSLKLRQKRTKKRVPKEIKEFKPVIP